MNITIDKYDFFILLEPYIDKIELHSPLYEFIVNAPIDEWDSVDLEIKKQEIELLLSENELTIFKDIIQVLSKPDFEYEISSEIENEKIINFLYGRDEKISEYLFDSEEKFELSQPKSINEKIKNYIKLIDVSKYQVDPYKTKHIVSFDEYLVLNIAFSLVEMNGIIDSNLDETTSVFTPKDILEEFEDTDDYKSIHSLFLLASVDTEEIQLIDIPKCINRLIEKKYLSLKKENKLSLDVNSIALYSNLFKLNSVKFSYYSKKFINDYEDVILKHGVFISSKESTYHQYFENKKVVIENISNRDNLEKIIIKAFSFNEFI